MSAEAVQQPRQTDFVTSDLEAAHAFLEETYSEQKVRVRGSRDGFRMRHAQVDSGAVTLATFAHTIAVEHDSAPLGGLLIARVLAGETERATAGEVSRYRPGDVYVVARPEDAFSICWNRVRCQLAWIDLDLLGQVAEVEDGREVRLTGLNPITSIQARHWRVTVDYVMASLTMPGQPAGPLVVGSAARMLAAATLSTFPNTATGARGGVPSARRPDTTPAMVRRAIDAMEERAHEDLSPLQLATAARVSQDELRLAFRRHLSTTPGAYLRQIRLDRAHEELLYPDPDVGTAVPDVAARWGFAYLDDFTDAYRAAYGRTPEETLRAGPRRSPGRPAPSRPG